MAKQLLPVYSIHQLKHAEVTPKDFLADNFGHYLDVQRNLHFPHKHNFYQLVYFSKGSGSHSIDFVHFPVGPGQIYFMIPGQVHTWDFANTPDGYIANFSDQYFHSLIADPRYLDQFPFFSGTAREQVIEIPVGARQQVETIFQTVVREANSSLELRHDFVRTALIQLFISVDRLITKDGATKQGIFNSMVLKNFQALIELHYKDKRLTRDYAAMLYITPNHLNATCKHLTGRSAGELIRDRVLLEAKRLLVNAKLPVSGIAMELQFADNSYFSKFFKKYTGVTPEVFRKEVIKK